MESITLTINGKMVSARSGTTILELTRDMGIHIPTLCYHPSLSLSGACRICLIEEETREELLPACSTSIIPGMVIQTDSPLVHQNRRTILELMLANHAQSCLMCAKGNRCELRKLAADMGIGSLSFHIMPHSYHIRDANPFMVRDMSRCILCGKCVRADQELVVGGVLRYFNRGFESRPETTMGRPLEDSGCTFCGTCLEMCPTGAISESDRVLWGSASREFASLCTYCGCGCLLRLGLHNETVVEARPEPSGSVNGLTICVRGRFGFEYVNNPERLQEPLIREGGGWHPLSWEKALDHLAKEFNRLRDKYGPQSLGFVCGSNLSCQEGYLLQRLARGLGTNNLAQEAGYVENMVGPFKEALGWIGSTQPLSQLEQAELVVVLGVRMGEAVPVMNYHLKRAVRNNQAELIVIDPVWSELCEQADYWFRPLPQGDGFMFTALMKILLEKGWLDETKGSQWKGWGELMSYLEGVSLEKCAEWCGLEEDSLVRIASLLNSSNKTAFVIGRGLTNQSGAPETLKALVDLYLLLGGPERHGLFPVYYESNALGLGLMGVSGRYGPGFVADGQETGWAGIKEVCEIAGPKPPELSLGEMLSQAETGDLRGLFLLQYDPLTSWHDGNQAKKALEVVEFLVVQDLFKGPGAEYANLLLPGTSAFETGGTFINLERRVQTVGQGIRPPGEARSAVHLLTDLSRRVRVKLPEGEDLEKEMTTVLPGLSGTFDPSTQPFFWPGGKRQIEEDARVSFSVPNLKRGIKISHEYPVMLARGDLLFHHGSGLRSHRSRRLHRMAPDVRLFISGEDAERLSVETGDTIRAVSVRGSLEIPVEVKKGLMTGTALLPRSFPGLSWNELFSGEGSAQWVAVRLEKP